MVVEKENDLIIEKCDISFINSFNDGGVIYADSFNIIKIINSTFSNIKILNYDNKGGIFFSKGENNTFEILNTSFINISSPIGDLLWQLQKI